MQSIAKRNFSSMRCVLRDVFVRACVRACVYACVRKQISHKNGNETVSKVPCICLDPNLSRVYTHRPVYANIVAKAL